MILTNRTDAGIRLAGMLKAFKPDWSGWTVVGINHGGALIAIEIARAIRIPFSALALATVESPLGRMTLSALRSAYWRPARGAGQFVHDAHEILPQIERTQAAVIFRQTRLSRQLFQEVPNRAIVCDEEIGTGERLHAALGTLRLHGARDIVIAVPVIRRTVLNGEFDAPIVACSAVQNDADFARRRDWLAAPATDDVTHAELQRYHAERLVKATEPAH